MRNFFTHLWFQQRPLLWLLYPFSCLFQCAVSLRRWCYKKNWCSTVHASVPVVVIGNLTEGGNGKTPLVLWLIEALTQKGLQVGVVSRGYGGKSSQYPLLVQPSTPPQVAGDEALLLVQRAGVPVCVDPDRVRAIQSLLAAGTFDLILSDDGLQHYRMGREVEIIVVDGQRRLGNGCLLPSGPLREPASRLTEVDAIVINGGETRNPSEIRMNLCAEYAVNLVTGEKKVLNNLHQCVAIAGIGYPERFFQMLRDKGAPVKAVYQFSDHYPFVASDLMNLCSKGEDLIMTEKDAVKCRSFAQPNYWYVPVTACIEKEDAFRLLQPIIKKVPSGTASRLRLSE